MSDDERRTSQEGFEKLVARLLDSRGVPVEAKTLFLAANLMRGALWRDYPEIRPTLERFARERGEEGVSDLDRTAGWLEALGVSYEAVKDEPAEGGEALDLLERYGGADLAPYGAWCALELGSGEDAAFFDWTGTYMGGASRGAAEAGGRWVFREWVFHELVPDAVGSRGVAKGPVKALKPRWEHFPGGRRVERPVMYARYRCVCGWKNTVLRESWEEVGFHVCKNPGCRARVYADDEIAYDDDDDEAAAGGDVAPVED